MPKLQHIIYLIHISLFAQNELEFMVKLKSYKCIKQINKNPPNCFFNVANLTIFHHNNNLEVLRHITLQHIDVGVEIVEL